jgi:hypothetical protein
VRVPHTADVKTSGLDGTCASSCTARNATLKLSLHTGIVRAVREGISKSEAAHLVGAGLFSGLSATQSHFSVGPFAHCVLRKGGRLPEKAKKTNMRGGANHEIDALRCKEVLPFDADQSTVCCRAPLPEPAVVTCGV